MISYVNKLGIVRVGGSNPVRIMGILNTSPESFYKKSVSIGRQKIIDAVHSMEEEGADFIDVGGMSTAPYLSTMVPEKIEMQDGNEGPAPIMKTGLFSIRFLIFTIGVFFGNNESNNLHDWVSFFLE